MSESLRADVEIALTPAQRQIVDHDGTTLLRVSGPAGSGKTAALAARAVELSKHATVLVICPHIASCDAFRSAVDRTGSSMRAIDVDTLAGHLARLMRTEFAASGAPPELIVGSDVDSAALARAAGRTLLDMSWSGFRSADFTLDLPFLGRPDIFFDEAANLFRQLRSWRVTPDEFEAQCAAGLVEFYGDDVERARVYCADRDVRARASSRGREALMADVGALRTQKRAERELSILLGFLYREYRTAARGASVLCSEDIIDEGLLWLECNDDARARLGERFSAIIVDDAEDAEPASAAFVELMMRKGMANVAIASCDSSAIDGLSGRRALALETEARQIILPPRPERAAEVTAARYPDDSAEADSIARIAQDLLASGAPPSDIMVLSRDESAARVYCDLLAGRGIPIVAPPSAWQAPHDIADLLALACVVDDPYDHAHLLRVLASPLVGLSDASLRTLCRDSTDAAQLSLDVGLDEKRVGGGRGIAAATLAQNALYGLVDLRLGDWARGSLESFRQSWSEWRSRCSNLRPGAAIAFLSSAAGFRAAWHAAPPFMRARLMEDGRRLVAAAARSSAGSLRATAASLEAGFGCVAPARDSSDAIACRTIVGAKGLRAPYVFVTGIAHERFPRVYISRSMAYSKNFGLIVRENVAGGASQTAKFAWYYAKFGAKKRYLDEERRKLQYALARADRAAYASGYGKPPRWAADQDLLAALGA